MLVSSLSNIDENTSPLYTPWKEKNNVADYRRISFINILGNTAARAQDESEIKADALLCRDKPAALTVTIMLVIIHNDPETQIEVNISPYRTL